MKSFSEHFFLTCSQQEEHFSLLINIGVISFQAFFFKRTFEKKSTFEKKMAILENGILENGILENECLQFRSWNKF